MFVTNGCTTNVGGWFGGLVRLVPPSRDPDRYKRQFTLDCISTKPWQFCIPAETTADAIALPMAFDDYRLKWYGPSAVRLFARTDPKQICGNRKSRTAAPDVGDSRQTVWGERQFVDALATNVG